MKVIWNLFITLSHQPYNSEKSALDMDSVCGEKLNINQKMVGYSHGRYATIVPVGMEISKEP